MKSILFIILILACLSAKAQTHFSRATSLPFGLAVSGPLLPSMKTGIISPDVTNIGTLPQTIWDEAVNYEFLQVATILNISSSSALDTSAGTGLRMTSIDCLDENWDQFTEIVTLNGQTPVPMVKACLKVQGNGMTGLTAGVTGSNAGKIYIGDGAYASGVPGRIMGSMMIGSNQSNFGVFSVPRNHNFFITQFSFSNNDNKNTEMFVNVIPEGGLRVKAVSFNVSSQSFTLKSIAPTRVTEKTDIELRAVSPSASSSIKVLATYILAPGV